MKLLHGNKSCSSGAGNSGSDDDVTVEHRNTLTNLSCTNPKPSSYAVDINMTDPLKRRYRDQKVVGLAEGVRWAMHPTPPELLEGSKKVRYKKYNGNIPLEDDEKYARSKEERRPIVLVIIGYYTALKIFLYYLISLSSLIAVGLSVGMTMYWYNRFQNVSHWKSQCLCAFQFDSIL